MGIWAELPFDLLVQIANRVKVMEDFIALRAVCTSWRVAITESNFDMFSPQVPLLMLGGAKYHKYREFYSLSKKKISRIFLPEARGRDCVSSEGWLCTVSYTGKMNLLHPFSRTQIQLPPLKSLFASHGVRKVPTRKKHSLIEKVVLSVSPSVTSDYMLMVSIFTKRNYLAFWRPGDLNWTPSNITTWGKATSIIYYKGQFYCVTCQGQLWVFESKSIKWHFVVWVEHYFHPGKKYYLAKISDALLIITQIFNGDESRNSKFKVFEIDTIRGRLNAISNLGDSSIFLSRHGASFINCSVFPGVVKPNHIYFTRMRTYNLEDENIEYFYSGVSSICPLTWVTPSFHQCDVLTQTKSCCCLFELFKLLF